MKIGIIGLGDIATKAYLPVITTMNIDLVLCSRNAETVDKIAQTYRIKDFCYDYKSLMTFSIDAVFIHTATSSHYGIAKFFLTNGVHVYVDKPISDRLEETLELYDLALSNNLVLMAGFNRRYLPLVSNLIEKSAPDTLMIQKNRYKLPGDIRTFIYDDFIHVIDTLLFLFRGNHTKFDYNALIKENQLNNIVVILKSEGRTAIGSMNRMSGGKEEVIEYTANNVKYIIEDLDRMNIIDAGKYTSYKPDDWTPVLKRRGFYDIITTFLNWTTTPELSRVSLELTIQSHELCEYLLDSVKKDHMLI